MDKAGIFSSSVDNGIAVATLGSKDRIHLDPEMAECLYDALKGWASDDGVRVIVLTGGAPGYFLRHYSVAEIVTVGEMVQRSGVELREDAEPSFFALDHAITLCETMAKPVVAAISGTCMGGALELSLGCDIRIAEDGPYEIGFPEVQLGILPGAGGTQRLPRAIGMAPALMHILLGEPVCPTEAARLGIVHEAVGGKSLDRAMAIARKLAALDAPALAHIKRLVRSAQETPLSQGLMLERNLFTMLAASDAALERMRDYEAGKLNFRPDP